MNYYKVTDLNGNAIHGGSFLYDLPSNAIPGKAGAKNKKANQPGTWTPDVWPIQLCRAGYHVTDAAGLKLWRARQRHGSRRVRRVWLVQVRRLYRDPAQDDEHKYVARQIRLIREVNPFVLPANTSNTWERQDKLTPAERKAWNRADARADAERKAMTKKYNTATAKIVVAKKKRVRTARAKLIRQWDAQLAWSAK